MYLHILSYVESALAHFHQGCLDPDGYGKRPFGRIPIFLVLAQPDEPEQDLPH